MILLHLKILQHSLLPLLKLQDSNYLARYARENYDYTKDGEYVIKINKEEKEEKNKEKTDIEIYRKYIYIGSTIVLLFMMKLSIRILRYLNLILMLV